MACPSIVDFVEKDKMNSQELMNYLTKKFAALGDRPADAVVLGCTHYPFIAEAIQKAAGPQAVLYDGSEGVARGDPAQTGGKKSAGRRGQFP